jgi:hypothetical protein
MIKENNKTDEIYSICLGIENINGKPNLRTLNLSKKEYDKCMKEFDKNPEKTRIKYLEIYNKLNK